MQFSLSCGPDMKLLFLGTFGENRQNQGAFCNFSLKLDKVGVNAVRGEKCEIRGKLFTPRGHLTRHSARHSLQVGTLAPLPTLRERWSDKIASICHH